MPADPHDLLESVTDEASFIAFAKALLADRIAKAAKELETPSSPYGPGANGWENGTIEQFLDGAVSWAEATNMGLTQGLESNNPWKRFAVFLYCGKIYEGASPLLTTVPCSSCKYGTLHYQCVPTRSAR